jgi:hypothetical protein
MKSNFKPALMMFVVAVIPTAFLITQFLLHGIILSPDSHAYLYAGENFLKYGSFLRSDGSFLTLFSPLYPAAIAVASLFTNSVEHAAMLVNIACMFSGSIIVFAILRRFGINGLCSALGVLAIFLDRDMQVIFSHAWSEVLYIPITLMILLLCSRIETYSIVTTGVMFGFLVGCAFLTRYVGVSLLVVALAGLAALPCNSALQCLKGMMSTTFVSMVIIGLWIIRNYHADGTFLGLRTTSTHTIANALEQAVIVTGRFILPGDILVQLTASIIITVVFILFLAIASRWERQTVITIIPAMTLIIAHMGIMIYSVVNTVVDSLLWNNGRLLIPVLAPIVIITVVALKNSRLSLNTAAKRVLAGSVLFLYFFLEIMSLS